MTKLMIKSKCTSVAAHFEGLAHVPVLCGVHCLMQHVQGYSGSHWTPPPGNYSLCIAPVATGATANKTTMTKFTNFAGHFDGRGGVPVQYHAHCLMEDVQGFGRSHWTPPWASIAANSSQLDKPTPVFSKFIHDQLVENEHKAKGWPLITLGV
jgi:hypothetical protein